MQTKINDMPRKSNIESSKSMTDFNSKKEKSVMGRLQHTADKNIKSRVIDSDKLGIQFHYRVEI